MNKGVVIINCARGGVVDEEALYEALKSGQVGAAALDGFESEPIKDFKLFSLPNVIGTPHIGAQTKEGQERAGIGIAEEVRKVLLGKLPQGGTTKPEARMTNQPGQSRIPSWSLSAVRASIGIGRSGPCPTVRPSSLVIRPRIRAAGY